MPKKLYIDFETRSASDLKKEGVHKYADHPTTDILCMGWAFDDDAPLIHILPKLGTDDLLPVHVYQHIKSGGLVVAHNATFEHILWNSVGVKKYNWPKLEIAQMSCTMARAYSMALPGNLDGAAAAVGIQQRKDLKGHRLMLKLSKPKPTSPPNSPQWWTEPSDFEKLYQYCLQDVVVERELDKRLLELSPFERRVWLLDQTINSRGVAVDVRSVKKAIEIVDKEQTRLDQHLRLVTGNKVPSAQAHISLKRWLQEQLPNQKIEGADKNDVAKLLLRDDLPHDVRRALELRQEAAKSSTAKLEAIYSRACADERVKGLTQYHGAGTGRFAGRGIQTQNFPRPVLTEKEIDDAFYWIENYSAADCIHYFNFLHGSAIGVVSSCLRGMLTAGPGKDLVAADWNSIEARVLAWLAGEEKVLQTFRENGDIYKLVAAEIYRIPVSAVTKAQRQVGKVAVLALGYQGGVGALQTMARGYGMQLEPAFDGLWIASDAERKAKAMQRWEQERPKQTISMKEWLASELVKVAWRDANQKIVAYWSEVEAAAIRAVQNPGVSQSENTVKFLMKGSFLFCKLPSGRNLCYPYPEVKMTETPWGQKKLALSYMAEDSMTRKWERKKAYGGLLVENITQAVARDILVEAMLRCEENGYRIVLHVHDEIVAEVCDQAVCPEIENEMTVLPTWAAGLPLTAEGWIGKRFRK